MASTVMHSVIPFGTTVYDPDLAYNGFTLFNLSPVWKEDQRGLLLIDMNGTTVHSWDRAVMREFSLLDTGSVLVAEVEGDPTRFPSRHVRTREYNWHDELVWSHEPDDSLLLAESYFQLAAGIRGERLSNGNTLVVVKRRVPRERMREIADGSRRRRTDYLADCIVEVTPAGETVWEWRSHDHLDMNEYLEIDESANWTHFNSLQVLPENRWFDAGDLRFRPGNLLVSPRTLGFVFVIDRDTGDIVWRSDRWLSLSGQHAPRMIEKGYPGEGNILVLDNGVPPLREVYRVGISRVLEVNPITFDIEWSYENGYRFFTPFTGNAQRLPNGNTLICEAINGRLFEVTPDGVIVWEYVVDPRYVAVDTSYRYPFDYSPQLEALWPRPHSPVVPDDHVVLKPLPIKTGDHHTRAAPAPGSR